MSRLGRSQPFRPTIRSGLPPSAGGPNNFTAPITDTLPAESDSIPRTQTLARILTETLPSFAESITAVRTFARAITDTLPVIADTVTRAQALSRQIIDRLPGGGTAFPQVLPFKGTSPTSSTTDILTPHGLMLGRVMTDDLAFVPLAPASGLIDTMNRVLAFGRQIADSVNSLFSDTVARSAILARQITETITTSETLGRAATYSRQITDSIGSLFSDTISAIKNGGGGTSYVRGIADTLPVIADGVTRLFTGARSLIETFSTSDVLGRAQTLARQIVGTLTTTETIARVWNGARSLSDSLTTSDTVARAAAYARQITDSVAGLFSEAVTAVKNSHAYTATITDTLPVLSDALSRLFSGARQMAETIATSDVVQRAAAYVRTITGTLPTFSDSASRLQGFVRQVADSLATNDAVQRVAGYARQATETITTVDSVQRAASYGRQVADTVSNLFGDIISAIKNLIVHKPGACTVSIAPSYSAVLTLAPTYTCTVSIDN